MTRTHPRLGRRRGQSLVEFALVVPVLLMVLVGLIEFGRAWNVSQTVTFAARQGSRIAAVLNVQGLPDDEARDSVVAVVTKVLASNNIACTGCVEIPIAGLNGGANTPVEVRVGVPYQFMLLRPFVALADDGLITLRSAAVMRNE